MGVGGAVTVFPNLTPELHESILDFLIPKDVLQLGRCCRSSAAFVCGSISDWSLLYCRNTDNLRKLVEGYKAFLLEEVHWNEPLRQLLQSNTFGTDEQEQLVEHGEEFKEMCFSIELSPDCRTCFHRPALVHAAASPEDSGVSIY